MFWNCNCNTIFMNIYLDVLHYCGVTFDYWVIGLIDWLLCVLISCNYVLKSFAFSCAFYKGEILIRQMTMFEIVIKIPMNRAQCLNGVNKNVFSMWVFRDEYDGWISFLFFSLFLCVCMQIAVIKSLIINFIKYIHYLLNEFSIFSTLYLFFNFHFAFICFYHFFVLIYSFIHLLSVTWLEIRKLL